MIIRCRLCGRTQNRDPEYVAQTAKKLGFASVHEYKSAYLCKTCRNRDDRPSDAFIRSLDPSPSSERLMTLDEVLAELPSVEFSIDSEDTDAEQVDRQNTDENSQ